MGAGAGHPRRGDRSRRPSPTATSRRSALAGRAPVHAGEHAGAVQRRAGTRRAARPSSTSTATRSSPRSSGSTGTPSSTSRSRASSPERRPPLVRSCPEVEVVLEGHDRAVRQERRRLVHAAVCGVAADRLRCSATRGRFGTSPLQGRPRAAARAGADPGRRRRPGRGGALPARLRRRAGRRDGSSSHQRIASARCSADGARPSATTTPRWARYGMASSLTSTDERARVAPRRKLRENRTLPSRKNRPDLRSPRSLVSQAPVTSSSAKFGTTR